MDNFFEVRPWVLLSNMWTPVRLLRQLLRGLGLFCSGDCLFLIPDTGVGAFAVDSSFKKGRLLVGACNRVGFELLSSRELLRGRFEVEVVISSCYMRQQEMGCCDALLALEAESISDSLFDTSSFCHAVQLMF